MNHRQRMRNRHNEYGLHVTQSSTSAPELPVRLHIEHLIVDGLADSDRERFAKSVQTGLEKILAEQGMASQYRQSMQADQVITGQVSLTPGMAPETYGQQVARAASGGISQLHRDGTTKQAGGKA